MFPIPVPKDGACTCRKGEDCPKPGKHPMHKGWQEKAGKCSLEDMRKICDPSNGKIGSVVNQGIRTGVEITPGFRLVVVDGDSPAACSWIESFGGSGTRTAVSGRGKHYYFSVPDHVEVHGATGIVPGVDVRGQGGLVVAPGSLHASGYRYRWESEGPVVPMPRTLLDKIFDHRDEKAASKVVDGFSRGRITYGEIRVSTRHEILVRIAASLRSRGYHGEGLSRAMGEINEGACEVPLPAKELGEIVKYALRMKPKRDAPVSEEELEMLSAMKRGYETLRYTRPFSISDKAILIALVHAGTVNGVGGVGEIKVPISYRVLAEKAGLSLRTVIRRLGVLEEFGFIGKGKNAGVGPQKSGFIALKALVADRETGEVLFDVEDFLRICHQDKRKRGVIGPIEAIGGNGEHSVTLTLPYSGDTYARNGFSGLVLSLRNGPGRIGKTSGDALDRIIPLLYSSEEPLTPRGIALALGLDPKDRSVMEKLSRRLKKLREKGIVEKENGRYKLLPEAEEIVEDAVGESREGLKKQVEDHEKDRIMHGYSLALWQADKDGKDLEEVPVPEGIRKSRGVRIREENTRSEKT